MKDFLGKPKFMREATGKPHNIVIEILIFLLVFLIANIVTAVILTVVSFVYMMFDPNIARDILSAATQSEDMTADAIMNVMPDGLMLLTLLCTAITTVTVMIYCRFIEKRKFYTMGFLKKDAFKEYIIGFVVGIVMISVPALGSILTGTATFEGLSASINVPMLLLFLLGFLLQGMSEEVLCRGYLMVSISRKYKVIIAAVVNAAIFGGLHLLNSGLTVLSMVNLIFYSEYLHLYTWLRGSIWGICALHSSWNFFESNFYGVQVSGSNVGPTVFTMTLDESKSFINGGVRWF